MDAPDYLKLINPQMLAFIEKSQAQYPSNATDQTIEEQRATYQKLCLDFNYGRPVGVVSKDVMIQHIPVRRYFFDTAISDSQNKNSASPTEKRLIIYFHGGGFVLGNLDHFGPSSQHFRIDFGMFLGCFWTVSDRWDHFA